MPGVERMRAFFQGHAFTPHRHDTYAVGVTSAGVQSFTYRGVARHSLPGEVFVLHPDERHDGRAGDDHGFGYRIAYIDPVLIRDAAAIGSLPFVREPVSGDQRLRRAVSEVLAGLDDPPDGLMATCSVVALADALVRAAGVASAATGSLDTAAVGRARDLLMEGRDARVSIEELEAISGLSRWQLARQFRRAFGVSPYRFHLLRRLDRARDLLGRGHPLAEVAHGCDFADQAHFTRAFRSAYGLSPGRWRALASGHAGAASGRG
jgi:AraC-like DNA-binding protein